MKNYIYFIQEGNTHLYKVGRTNDPAKRLKELQTGNPRKLNMYHIIECYNMSAACRLELNLHKYLAGQKVLNEWYKLDKKHIKEIIKFIEMFK